MKFKVDENPPEQYPGFIILRPQRLDKNSILELTGRLTMLLNEEAIENRLWICRAE
ncbi:MAG TPA: hypothetical protein VK009_27370 [Chloroflexota bacterium]|nr:hypothetical protein [Chloroflexota bacterium]